MITVLAIELGDPLMLMFGIMAAAAAGGAAGYVFGIGLGRTRPSTPLPTTIKLTRDQIAAASQQVEKASQKLQASQRSELAGSALVVGRRLADMTSALGRIGHKASKEGSA